MLVVALVVAAAAAAAVPAAAAPAPSKLTVTPQSATVKWDSTLILNGLLQEDVVPPLPLDRMQVQVQRSTTGSDPWTLVATVTNTAAPYSSGAYVYSETATRTYYWRMHFAGDGQWAAVTSAPVKIGVKPLVGKPSAPRRAKARGAFQVSGSLKPRFSPGSRAVKLRWQVREHGRWKAYRTVWAGVADSGSFSKYSVSVTVKEKGTYRFYGETPATARFALSQSAFSRAVTVE
jgi:hypothetical protein